MRSSSSDGSRAQRRVHLARLTLCLLLPACVQEGELPVLAPGGPVRGELPALAFIGNRSETDQALYVLPREADAPPRRILGDIDEGSRGAPPRIAVSPDGRFIAYSRSGGRMPGEITLVEVGTQTRRLLLTPETYVSGPLAWSPDGSQLAFVGRPPDTLQDYDEEIFVVGTAAGSVPRKLTRDNDNVSSPVWSPDGRWVRFLLRQSTAGALVALQALADGTGTVEQIAGAPSLESFTLSRSSSQALSADGRRLAYSSDDPGGTRLCIRGPQGEHCVLERFNSSVGTITFTADGRAIAFSALWPEWQDTELFAAWVDRGGSTMLTDLPGGDEQPAFFSVEVP